MKKSRIDVVSAIPGDERHDVSDDDLIVEDGGTKGEYNQRQQRYDALPRIFVINLEFLWRFKANRNTCSSMPIKKPTMLSRAVPPKR